MNQPNVRFRINPGGNQEPAMNYQNNQGYYQYASNQQDMNVPGGNQANLNVNANPQPQMNVADGNVVNQGVQNEENKDIVKLVRMFRSFQSLCIKQNPAMHPRLVRLTEQTIQGNTSAKDYESGVSQILGHNATPNLLKFLEKALPVLRNDIQLGKLTIDSILNRPRAVVTESPSPQSFHGVNASPQPMPGPSPLQRPAPSPLQPPNSDPTQRSLLTGSPMNRPPASVPASEHHSSQEQQYHFHNKMDAGPFPHSTMHQQPMQYSQMRPIVPKIEALQLSTVPKTEPMIKVEPLPGSSMMPQSVMHSQPSTSFMQPQPSTSFMQSKPPLSMMQHQTSTSTMQTQPSTSLMYSQQSTSMMQPQPSTSMMQPPPSTSMMQTHPSTSMMQPQQSTLTMQPQPLTSMMHAQSSTSAVTQGASAAAPEVAFKEISTDQGPAEKGIFDRQSFAARLHRKMPECDAFEENVLMLLSDFLEVKVRDLIKHSMFAAGHRMEPLDKNEGMVLVCDPKKQLLMIERHDKAERQRKELLEKEQILKASKGKSKDTDILEKAKQLKKADQDELSNRQTNEAAMTALAGTKRQWQSKSTTANVPTINRVKKKHITMRDLMYVFEKDAVAKNSIVYRKMLYGLNPE